MMDAIGLSIRDAGERAEVREAVSALYGRVMEEIARRRPVCEMSGRCCKFEEYGHRLFVTTMEMGAFWWEWRQLRRREEEAWSGRGCPFQVGKLCGVHGIRPFGCRMFFCDPSSTDWQQEMYERFHGELKRLHEDLNVPYCYLEWRQALAAAGISSPQILSQEGFRL